MGRFIQCKSSPWATVKSAGAAFVPNGQPSQAFSRLLSALQNLGILLVPVGEVEGFAKTVGGHGPGWVNEVVKKNLKEDEKLQEARSFFSHIVAAVGEKARAGGLQPYEADRHELQNYLKDAALA